MRIGTLDLDRPLILAPMAGITDQYFRLILKRIGGVGLVTMEFISSEALTRGSQKTRHLMQFSEEERPLAIQIYGSDPSRMADAAEFVQALGSVPPATLTTRLAELEHAGILERSVVGSRPPRVEYVLTERGRQLRDLVEALRRFAEL